MKANSRMKDYFDLLTLARRTVFDGETLRITVAATFERRGTVLTVPVPLGLTDAFAQNGQKQVQWLAFLKKNRLEAVALHQVIAELAAFLSPI